MVWYASALFTALPRIVEADMLPARSSDVPSVPFALADDGIGIDVAELAVNAGNVGIIGSAGRGKSTILALLAHRSRDILGLCVRWTRREDGRSSRRRYAITDGCGSPPNRHLPYPRICCGWWTMPTHCSIRSARAAMRTAQGRAGRPRRHRRVRRGDLQAHPNPRALRHENSLPHGERTVGLMDGIPAGLLSQCAG